MSAAARRQAGIPGSKARAILAEFAAAPLTLPVTALGARLPGPHAVRISVFDRTTMISCIRRVAICGVAASVVLACRLFARVWRSSGLAGFQRRRRGGDNGFRRDRGG